MRINGFEQIKAFYSWVFNNPEKVRPTHISLYLFLWNQANRSNWVDWFKCPYDLAMQGACIGSNTTYYKCLDDLQKYKLIKYKKGLNNWRAPQIHLIQLYKNEQASGQASVPLSGQPSGQLSVLLTGNTYKLLTSNCELVNDELENWIKNHKKSSPSNLPNNLHEDSLYPIDRLKEIYVNEAELVSSVTENEKISEKKLKEYLNKFNKELKLRSIKAKKWLDYVSHFLAWLRIQLNIKKYPNQKLSSAEFFNQQFES